MDVMCVFLLYIRRTAPAVSYKSRTNKRHSWLSFYARNSFVSVKSHSYKQIKKYKMLFLCFVRCVYVSYFSSFFFLHAVRKWKSENHRRTFLAKPDERNNESNYGHKRFFSPYPYDAFNVKGGVISFLFFIYIYIIDLFCWKCRKFESECFNIDVENMMKNVLSWRSINRTNTFIF